MELSHMCVAATVSACVTLVKPNLWGGALLGRLLLACMRCAATLFSCCVYCGVCRSDGGVL